MSRTNGSSVNRGLNATSDGDRIDAAPGCGATGSTGSPTENRPPSGSMIDGSAAEQFSWTPLRSETRLPLTTKVYEPGVAAERPRPVGQGVRGCGSGCDAGA